jgi:hypothetical protein
MPMAAVQSRARIGADDLPPAVSRKETSPMSASVATNGHDAHDTSNLRALRIVVFGGIGALYLTSLFVPPLREALARIFSYFPQ